MDITITIDDSTYKKIEAVALLTGQEPVEVILDWIDAGINQYR